MILLAFLAQTLRIVIPYLLAAAGGVLSERAGIVALTLEGFMLTGAFTAALGSYYAGSPWVGLLAGMLGGVALALLLALATVRYRADHVEEGREHQRDQLADARALLRRLAHSVFPSAAGAAERPTTPASATMVSR